MKLLNVLRIAFFFLVCLVALAFAEAPQGRAIENAPREEGVVAVDSHERNPDAKALQPLLPDSRHDVREKQDDRDAIKIFTILTVVFGAFGVVWKGYEVLNRDRDRVLSHSSGESSLSLRHKLAIIKNDWVPMHLGLMVFIFVVTVGLFAGPHFLGDTNPGIIFFSSLAGALGLVAFLGYAHTFPRDRRLLYYSIQEEAVLSTRLRRQISIRECNTADELREFVAFGRLLARIGGNQSQPLDTSEFLRIKLAGSTTQDSGHFQCWLAFSEGLPVGRIAARITRDCERGAIGTFGFFGVGADPKITSKLVGAVASWLRIRGATEVRGPFDFNSNGRVGVLTSGFEHATSLDIPHNPSWTGRMLLAAGFSAEEEINCWISEVGNTRKRVADMRASSRCMPEWTMEKLSAISAQKRLKAILGVYNAAWQHNLYFTPMRSEEIRFYLSEMDALIREGFAALGNFQRDPRAIVLALPEVSELVPVGEGHHFERAWRPLLQAIWRRRNWRPHRARVVLLGVVRDRDFNYVRRDVALWLIEELLTSLHAIGIHEVEWSWTLESNKSISRLLEEIGCERYKRLTVYAKQL